MNESLIFNYNSLVPGKSLCLVVLFVAAFLYLAILEVGGGIHGNNMKEEEPGRP